MVTLELESIALRFPKCARLAPKARWRLFAENVKEQSKTAARPAIWLEECPSFPAIEFRQGREVQMP